MHVPSYSLSASSRASHAHRSRWLVGSSSTSTLTPAATSLATAARQVEGEVAEEGLVVALAQPLDLQDEVAGAADVAEVHVGRFDLRGPLQALEAVELFLARGGLLVELAVVDAADVLFLLLDL